MYSYDWDPSTGGYILNSTPLNFSKEPRPVYYKELDMLGFDRYWDYEKDDTYPICGQKQILIGIVGGRLPRPRVLIMFFA